MLKIRRPLGRLIFNMGIAIPGKTVFLIETAPWLRKHTLFKGNLTITGTEVVRTPKTHPILGENLIIPGTRSGADSKIIPYFREIWLNHTLFYGNWPFKNLPCRAAHPCMAFDGSAPTSPHPRAPPPLPRPIPPPTPTHPQPGEENIGINYKAKIRHHTL